jgi:hypothetical protein
MKKVESTSSPLLIKLEMISRQRVLKRIEDPAIKYLE